MRLLSERRGRERRRAQRLSVGLPVEAARERRRGERRRQIARAGMVAAIALAPRGHRPASTAELIGSAMPGDVQVAETYRLPVDERAMIDALIEEAAAVHGVSADLVRAVVQTESAFDPLAVSPVGAKGLMQLMPHTAREVGVQDPFDPRDNVFGGTKYLSRLLRRFDGNVALALAGYNAGPTNVRRHKGIPPFRETRNYVVKIRNILRETRGEMFPMPEPPRRMARSSRSSRTKSAAVRSASAKKKAASVKSSARSRRASAAVTHSKSKSTSAARAKSARSTVKKASARGASSPKASASKASVSKASASKSRTKKSTPRRTARRS